MITYNKCDSIIKHGVREEIFDKLKRLGNGPKNCITLPNLNFWLETNIIRYYKGSKCDCYEMNPFIYEKQKKLILNKSITLNNDDVFNCDFSKKYDFVWLDLCGGFTIFNIDNTIEMLNKLKFSKKALFALTLTTQRQDSAVEKYKNYPNYKHDGIIRHLSKYIEGVFFTDTIRYSCTDTSKRPQLMKTFIFTIRK
jgi:hypothetical protein